MAIGRRAQAAGVDVVRAADDVGVALAVEHLVGLGHHDIAFVDGPRGPIATLRRQGYRRAMKRLGLADASLVVEGGGDEEAGAAAAAALHHPQPSRGHVAPPVGGREATSGRSRMPSAVVAFNDRAALGLLDRLRREGVDVPGDVSVVGYDDSLIARLATVDLTSVSQIPEAMATAAVEAATQRLDDGRTEPVELSSSRSSWSAARRRRAVTRRPDGTAYARTDRARAVGGSGYGRIMADKLTRQAASDALPTWRFLLQRMHLTVQAPDVATAFDFVARVGAVAAPLGRQPDLDVRGTVVHLAVSTEPAGGVSDADIAVGRAVELRRRRRWG